MNQRNGFPVDIRDVPGLAQVMKSVKDRYHQYDPQEIRADFERRFSRRAFVETLSEIYRRTLETQSGGARRCAASWAGGGFQTPTILTTGSAWLWTACTIGDQTIDGRKCIGIRPTSGLARTRLSTVDLSERGHQPMCTPDRCYLIVDNGEIYDYRELKRELSRSDTEVLLAAWAQRGLEYLRRLEGMFAFGVVDHHENSLTLARDGFGIKPLLYDWAPSRSVIALEQQTLLTLRQERAEAN